MAQSEEHLRILELLGVRRGVVALTMADCVDDAAVKDVTAGIRSAVTGTFLEPSRIVDVDSMSGRGIQRLQEALGSLAAGPPATPPVVRPRLWIDRSFAIAGAGTVVTGTLTGGSLTVGDPVDIVTSQGSRRARVRQLESFGAGAEIVERGRAAANLGGVSHQDLRRGDVVVTPGRWHLTSTFDASLEVLQAARRPVKGTGAHLVHLGTEEATGRLLVLGQRSIGPGELGLVRIRLPRLLPLVPGDRYVLRDAGSNTTVGGGEVLDVAPVRRPSKARPDRDVARVVSERGWVRADELERLTGVVPPRTIGGWVVDRVTEVAARRDLHSKISQAGAMGLDVSSLDERDRALVGSDDRLAVRHGRVFPHDAQDLIVHHPYLKALETRPFQPPSPEETGATVADARELVRRGLAMREGDLYFSPRAVALAAQAAADLMAVDPQGFTVAAFRVRLGTTRRFALALLALLDADGVTRRRGDVRIGGPRLPSIGERSE